MPPMKPRPTAQPSPATPPARRRHPNIVSPSILGRFDVRPAPNPNDRRSPEEIDAATAAQIARQISLSKNPKFKAWLRSADAKVGLAPVG